MTASALTDEALETLRAEAQRHAGPFIDPVVFRRVQPIMNRVPQDWLERVVGVPVPRRSHLDWWKWHLVGVAAELDRDHLDALSAKRRAEAVAWADRQAERLAAENQRKLDSWFALRDAMPVPCFAAHNWTIGHYDGYTVGKDHIVVLEPLTVGRFHRDARLALCETPSKQRSGNPGYHRNPLSHLEREPYDDQTSRDRIPTCRPCIRRAEQITGLSITPAGESLNA